tara:strand:- start:896 stop:1441 length:546 start_codon:yes stop_codon:yes gene_type:complete
LKKTFEIPKKGVKVYSPDEGWSEGHVNEENATQEIEKNLSGDQPNKNGSEENNNSSLSNTQSHIRTESIEGRDQNNMVAVGDALEQLFDTLNNSSSINSGEAQPTWRDVAELSRKLEEKLDTRKEILDQLAELDGELHATRKELLSTLKKLGQFENEQLSAATIRASVSAMAIEVLAKKLS